ncbi:MAG: LacI family transcriptional regulator [Lachnospiraceae bacterium]|jgi:DNA-binding LacI/PurR family transcriptional regulator|nr:LacI family transcriptional regulator [Lachnospiraceae bacterium]
MRRGVANIKDVAAAAGVSISTVSRVLNHSGNVDDGLQARVKRAVRDTGYSANPIASSLKSTRRNQIAIVIPTLKRNYYTDIIKGVSEFFYEKEIIPVILESGGVFEKERELIASLEKQWVDGIILIPGQYGDGEEYERYVDSLSNLTKSGTGIPVVLVEAPRMNPKLDVVRADHETAFYAMAEHLLEIGRRRIAYLGNAASAPLYPSATRGVEQAFAAYGLSLEQKYIRNNNYTVMEGYRSMMDMIREGLPVDGVLCVNDQVAAGALNACQERGIPVPQETAIVGFEGTALSIVTSPSITTMIVPKFEIGETAAKLLHRRMEGERGEPEQILLRVHMAVRASTMNSARKALDVMFSE